MSVCRDLPVADELGEPWTAVVAGLALVVLVTVDAVLTVLTVLHPTRRGRALFRRRVA